jgi:arylsulfatase A-like enzyme
VAAVVVLVVIALVAAAAVLGLGRSGAGTSGPTATPSPRGRPSIVFILTDDQRWDTLRAMPEVQRDLVRHGVTFADAFVDDSLCCPSRSSILTGLTVSHTGVWLNRPPLGGFPAFHDASTVATWLHGAGYRTGLFGKYLNRYPGGYVPPGWDRFAAFVGEEKASEDRAFYVDYDLSVNGVDRHFGSAPADYSTDVTGGMAVSFIRSTPGPLFLYWAPASPHAPFTPAPRDANAFATLPPFHPPSYFERDVSDKPAWVRRLAPDSAARDAQVTSTRRLTYQSLLDVDRWVGRIVEALRATGRLSNTMLVFTSDNGFTWGEHRWIQKIVPYDESIRVPLVVRFDPMTSTPRTDDHLIGNIDLAPTFGALARASVPRVDGRSFLPLLSDPHAPWRWWLLVEHMHDLGPPAYCELRTVRWSFVQYADGERELYDVDADPYELTNLAADRSTRRLQAGLTRVLRRECDPPPPGFHVYGR